MWKKINNLPLATTLMLGLVAALLTGVISTSSVQAQEDPTERPQIPGTDGVLIGADYWSDEPMILSAGLGFEGIIGVGELSEEAMREAGANWDGSMVCTNGTEPTDQARTSAPAQNGVSALTTGQPEFADALPIVFSWPVATETIDNTDFEFTLTNGETVGIEGFGMIPNWEYNERNTIFVYGEFANRGYASEADAIYPVRLEIVGDLILVGPGGQEVNARGMTWETDATPYDAGPVLVGAKLNFVDPEPVGEGGVTLIERTGAFPNYEHALYDEGDFRLRILTSGGFSPDGHGVVYPDDYENYFRIHANGADGETVLLEEVGVEYEVAGGTLRMVGLADLGQAEEPEAGIYYDDCYPEDRDNYIDIILVGDEEAARNVTFVEIPALEGGYQAFYNPGGPGPEPFEGVRYTAPGPADLEPVINALDDPMRVDRNGPSEPNIASVPQGDIIYAQNAGMVSEGIEWDAVNEQFLVGSISFGTIFSVQDNGVTQPFIESDNLTNSIGIHIDPATNRLLVASGNLAANLNEDIPGFARLGTYDMETREELHFVDLGSLYPDGRHFANDVTVDADGNAYVTDTLSPVIYKVDMDGNAEVFLEAPDLAGFNGIDYHPNGYLLVAMNANDELYKVPLSDPTSFSLVELSEPLSIDGMVMDDNLDVVAVRQTMLGDSVVRISSDDDWATATVVATAPALNRSFPTTVTLRDGQPYVLHANFLALQSGTLTLAYEILRTEFIDVE